MHIHILGICGTFMGGVAALAKAAGHRVSGSDESVYPPMSEQLEALGIELIEGYDAAQLKPAPELVIVGNALSRGNPAVEYLLDRRLDYVSGPQWLGEQFLRGREVIAVAGTHGKTTTTAMLAWILDQAGLEPGYLIGGQALDLPFSAAPGSGPFVIEADEYDTAFFDKRAKFVHYRPDILILNNLEYDHADIYPSLAAIQTQFHHLLRTVPGRGQVIHNAGDANLDAVLAQGCWSHRTGFGLDRGGWQVRLDQDDGSALRFLRRGRTVAELRWRHCGSHNALNALAALAAAAAAGVEPGTAARALAAFRGVRRRLEILHAGDSVTVYDDFAHHPTAIAATLQALRSRAGPRARLIAAVELRSNTMRGGQHRERLAVAFESADAVAIRLPENMNWDIRPVLDSLRAPSQAFKNTDDLLHWLHGQRAGGDNHVIFMSNGSFDAAAQRYAQDL